MTVPESADDGEVRIYIDQTLVGRPVQADGGSDASSASQGDQVARLSRETFEGTLTGRRFEQGDPPWKFMEIGNLTKNPDGSERDTVWCEESYVYFMDE
jgi:hypothetical protein